MNEGIDCRQCNPKGLAEFTTHAEWCPAVTQRMRQTKLARAQTDFATYRADVEPVLRAAVDYEACEEFEVSDKQMALSDAIAASRVCQRIAREGK